MKIVAATASMALMLTAGSALAQENVLFNPGWESTSNPSPFQGWSGFGNVFRETSAAISGGFGAKLFGNFAAVQNFSGLTQDLPAGPNQTWTITASAKHLSTDAMTGGNRLVIKFDYVDSSGTVLGSSEETTLLTALSPTDPVLSGTATGTTPEGTAFVRAAIVFIQESDFAGGAANVDDVQVSSSLPVTPPLINGGFETRGPSRWNQFNFAGRSTILPRTGTAGAVTGGLSNGGFNLSGIFQDVQASAGQTWTGSAFVQNLGLLNPLTGEDWAVLNIEWKDSANNTISFVSVDAVRASTPLNEWIPVTVSGTAPEGTVSARLVALYFQPAIGGAPQPPGQVFWDDFSMTLTPAGCSVADVTGIGGPPAGPDGLLTGDDFNSFISAFAAGDLLADITGIGGPPSSPDGLITGDDFNAFISAFAAGCP